MHSFLQDSDEIQSLVHFKVPPKKGPGKGKGKRRLSPPTPPYDSSSDSDVNIPITRPVSFGH